MSENQIFEKEGEWFFKNSRNKNICCKYWNTDYKENKPRALVFIVHGVGEHTGRHDRLAAELHSKLDAYVFSHDHHGHGRSDGHRVHTVDFSHYVDDIVDHVAIVRRTFSEAPLYLVGLSMGGTIAVKTILDHPTLCSGVCMIAPALTINPRDAPGWKIFSVKAIAKIIPNLSVGTVDNKHMCHDQAERDNYDNDPLNYHKGIKAGWAVQFYNTTQQMKKRYGEISLPVLTMHGDDDDVSPVEGSEELHRNMAGGDLQEIKVIPGAYHCLNLEPNGVGKACVEDIVEFLQKLIKKFYDTTPRIEVNAPTPTEVGQSTTPTEVGQSTTPEEVKSTTPEEVKSTTPEEVKSTTPEEVKSTTPEEVKSTTPEKVKSTTPEEKTTTEEVKTTPSEEVKTTPSEEVKTTPSEEEAKTTTSEEVKTTSSEEKSTTPEEKTTSVVNESSEANDGVKPEPSNAESAIEEANTIEDKNDERDIDVKSDKENPIKEEKN